MSATPRAGRIVATWVLVVALAPIAAQAESACGYDPNGMLASQIRQLADAIVQREAELVTAARLGSATVAISTQAVKDTAGGTSLTRAAISALVASAPDHEAVVEATQADLGAVGEVMRTDKQVGASSGSNGTTTLAERAAFPLLLGAAVEYGAIQQEKNGTSLTLSTSPYGLLILGHEDNADFYKDNWIARMFGVSANFLLQNESAGLDDLKASDFASVTAKATFGDRSPRSQKFEDDYQKEIGEIASQKVNAQATVLRRCAGNVDSPLYQKTLSMMADEGTYRRRLDAYVATEAYAQATQMERKAGLAAVIADQLCNDVTLQAASLSSSCDIPTVAGELEVISTLDRAQQAKAAELVETFQRETSLYSITYTLNRVSDGSDYSEIKLIGDGLLGYTRIPLMPVVNSTISFNHNPSGSLNQKTVRDYGATVSLATSIANPLAGVGAASPFAKIGVSISAAYSRLNDIDKGAAIVQASADVPLTGGFALPIALTYASRTETDGKDNFTINVGGLFDTERLLGLLRLGFL